EFSEQTFRGRKFVLAHAFHNSETTRLCLCSRFSGSGPTVGAAYWRGWVNAGQSFSRERSNTTRFANRWDASSADALLVRNFRQCIVDFRVDRSRLVAGCAWRLRQRNSPWRPLGDVHVNRARWTDLVRLWLGDSTTRDRLFVDLSLSVDRWASIPQMQAADSRYLALSMAWVSHHDRRGSDQIARRPVLARSNLSLLSLRDTADPEPHQPLFAFRATLVSQIRDGVEPFRRTDCAVVFIR